VPLPVSDLPVVIGARSGVAEGDATKPYTVPTAHGLAARRSASPPTNGMTFGKHPIQVARISA